MDAIRVRSLHKKVIVLALYKKVRYLILQLFHNSANANLPKLLMPFFEKGSHPKLAFTLKLIRYHTDTLTVCSNIYVKTINRKPIYIILYTHKIKWAMASVIFVGMFLGLIKISQEEKQYTPS